MPSNSEKKPESRESQRSVVHPIARSLETGYPGSINWGRNCTTESRVWKWITHALLQPRRAGFQALHSSAIRTNPAARPSRCNVLCTRTRPFIYPKFVSTYRGRKPAGPRVGCSYLSEARAHAAETGHVEFGEY